MPSVLFVAPSAYLLSGLATWLDYLVPGLRAEGWDANLALVSGPAHHRPEPYLQAHPAEGALTVHCATGTPEGRTRALLAMLGESRPDIAVSVNIPDLFPAINRMRLRSDTAPHAVMSVHGIEAFLYADAHRYREMLDAVVCTNRLACALTTSSAGLARDRVLYAPYGVDVPAFEKRDDDSHRLRIAYSGRLETPQKRAGDLVGIARGLSRHGVPFRLDIAGDGPDRADLESALRDEIGQGTVRFCGHVPPDVLKSQIYARAHALIVTSQWETGPIVAWEAMAQGVAVVSSRYVGSGLEGALEDGKNALLYDIGDPEAAASALARLWREPELREMVVAGGARLVRTRYSISASIAAWSEALGVVLNKKPLGSASLPRLAPAGRMDRWLGASAAESLRAALPLPIAEAPDPGGEWPHAHAKAPSDMEFWRLATRADRAAAEPELRHAG